MILKILIGVAAVALGVFLGRPRRYDKTQNEVDRALEQGRGRRQWTQRHFTPLDLLRKDERGSERRRGDRSRFQTTIPGDEGSRKSEDDGPPQVKLGR